MDVLCLSNIKMKNMIQKIFNGDKKVLSVLLAPAFLFASGCDNNKSTQYLPLCEGENVKYNNLEILVLARDGQRLVKADGKFYVGDEECFVDYSNSNNNISYTLEGKKKILTVKGKDNSAYRMVWDEDGSFHKEITIN